ncbi:MAG TPA: hypothetical protein GX741_02490 [Erysipelothrix sp.]|nr:hypothetical protein [Erysipelothrix sp.]
MLGTLAVGDVIAVKTKSIVSSMFTCSVIFILGFWLKVPQTLFSDAQLLGIGSLLITMLLVHMGTMMSLRTLAQQYKTVLIAIAAIVGIALTVLGIGQFIMGRNISLVAAPVISGGVIAALKMQESMLASGVTNAESLAVFATVLMVMEGFVGYPIASICLKKETKRVKKEIRENKVDTTEVTDDKPQLPVKPKRFQIADKYLSENFYLAKCAFVAMAATGTSLLIQKLTGVNIIDKNIMSLIFGIIFHEIGLLDSGILKKASSDGLAMAALMAVVFFSLTNATPQLLIEILPLILIAQVLGVIGYIVFGVIVGKLLNVSPWLSIAIGSTCNYGFPGTYVISNEVARAEGNTPQEQQAILDAILPKMLVAGFVTVSIASVFLAGIFATLI